MQITMAELKTLYEDIVLIKEKNEVRSKWRLTATVVSAFFLLAVVHADFIPLIKPSQKTKLL